MASIESIQELLGGEGVTGPLHSERDIDRLVRRGVPTEFVDRFLATSHLNFNLIERHVVARRTLKRRREAAQPLDLAESDRFVRLVRLVAAARDTFGDYQKVLAWMTRENSVLEGKTPLSLADTDLGARSVETLLGRIGHGIAA